MRLCRHSGRKRKSMADTMTSERYVVLGAFGSLGVLTGASLARGKGLPSAKQYLSLAVLWAMVAGVSDASPRIAGPLSGLTFASIGLYQGTDALKGVSRASKSYEPTAKNPAGGSVFSAPSPLTGVSADTQDGAAIAQAAYSQLGLPYSYGGGGASGPSRGITNPTVGFDCSGLTQYACFVGAGVSIPRVAADQYNGGTPVSGPGPGVLVFFDNTSRAERQPGHVGVCVSKKQFVQAPHTGAFVGIANLAGYPLKVMGYRYYGK